MAAILEWAGIAKNGRGELILTEEHNEFMIQFLLIAFVSFWYNLLFKNKY